MSKKVNTNTTKKALEQVSEVHAYLIGKTIKNITRGGYWAVVSTKEIKANGLTDKLSDLSAIAGVYPLGTEHFLLVYNNVEDFFDLFKVIKPDKAELIEQKKQQIFTSVNNNRVEFYDKFSKILDKALKHTLKAGKTVTVPIAIYCLNESNRTEVTTANKAKTHISAFMANIEDFLDVSRSFQNQKSAVQGLRLFVTNPITQKSIPIDQINDLSAFEVTNSKDTSGIWTVLTFA